MEPLDIEERKGPRMKVSTVISVVTTSFQPFKVSDIQALDAANRRWQILQVVVFVMSLAIAVLTGVPVPSEAMMNNTYAGDLPAEIVSWVWLVIWGFELIYVVWQFCQSPQDAKARWRLDQIRAVAPFFCLAHIFQAFWANSLAGIFAEDFEDLGFQQLDQILRILFLLFVLLGLNLASRAASILKDDRDDESVPGPLFPPSYLIRIPINAHFAWIWFTFVQTIHVTFWFDDQMAEVILSGVFFLIYCVFSLYVIGTRRNIVFGVVAGCALGVFTFTPGVETLDGDDPFAVEAAYWMKRIEQCAGLVLVVMPLSVISFVRPPSLTLAQAVQKTLLHEQQARS